MDDCIFCKIIAGEIPCEKVFENDHVLAFLDISQVTPGHTLLIPKKHLKDIFYYDSQDACNFCSSVPMIAKAIQKAFPQSKGLNMVMNNGSVAYQSVFHSHLHLIPRYSENDSFSMNFTNNSQTYSQEVFQERAKNIEENINIEGVNS